MFDVYLQNNRAIALCKYLFQWHFPLAEKICIVIYFQPYENIMLLRHIQSWVYVSLDMYELAGGTDKHT